MVEKVRGLEIKQEVVEVAKEVVEVANEVVKMAKVAKEVVEVAKKVIMVVEEFMACNLKDYDGKGGAIVYTRWIEKIESVQDMSGLVPHLVTLKNKRIERYIYRLVPQIHGMVVAIEPNIIQSAILKSRMLTDEVIRNGALNKNIEKRGNNGEPGRDVNVKDDNKRSWIERAFATITNPVRKEYAGSRPNQVMAIEGGQGRGNNGTHARGRAFVMGSKEARHDPNIVMGTFTLKILCCNSIDSGAHYSFVSTTFIPLLDIETSNLGFSYEIEIDSGQLIEISKVIRGCKLEIKVHIFDIDLISFGHGSFDVIVGMDWLSKHKAEIVFHEKVVRIPLPNSEMLRVLGERIEEEVRHLMSAKEKKQKLEDIIVVRNFSELQEVQFLGHVIVEEGIHVDPSKIEAVKNWKAPRTPLEVHSFLGLVGYDHRFIENFSKLAKPLTILTQQHKECVWGEEQKRAFQTLKDKLCNAPVLALLNGLEDFVVYDVAKYYYNANYNILS
uniref:Reverse transcriptase domain-containing protein n=1 Tax=Tanacetum cinerariifolium TaxID=118510 RepID=A0A699HWX3_TANCI|nr:reverse transcriptase domain-containing protein [Tanacetum cinerariifolium]